MKYRDRSPRRRAGRKRRRLGQEPLEPRRMLAAQLETGMAFEHVYLGDPYTSPEEEHTTAAQGDLDGDGRLDVLVFTSLNGAQFFAGQGDGTYVPSVLPHAYPPANWILTDVDADGDQDLLSVVRRKLLLSLNAGREDGLWQGLQPVTEQEILPAGSVTTFTAEDFHGDGYVDLALGTSTAIYVKSGLGDGRFDAGIQYPLRQGSGALVAGDLDGDGDLDLISAKTNADGGSDRQSLDLLINDGEGVFEPRESQAQFQGNINDLAVGDLDGDGHLDVVATHDNVSVALGDGAGDLAAEPMAASIAGSASSVSLGDIDDDGDLDVCVGLEYPYHADDYEEVEGVAVFLGRGDGGLGPRLFVAGNEATVAFPRDLDGAGADELTLVLPQGQVQVLRGVTSELLPAVSWIESDGILERAHYAEGDWDGNGLADSLVKTITGLELRLNPGTEWEQTLGVRLNAALDKLFLRDVTGDGRTDLLTSGPSGVYVLPQNEHGQPGELVFTPASATTLIPDGIVDLNRDGAADLLLLQGTDLYAWLGQGDGSFQPLGDAAVTRGRAFQVADWNTDGHADLMVLWANRLSVLHGTADGSFHETFHTAISAGTVLERVADLDGDGDLDVVLREETRWWCWFRGCDLRPGTARVMVNAGNGALQEMVQTFDYSFVENATEKLLIGWSDPWSGDWSLTVWRATSDAPQLSEVLQKTSTEGAYSPEAVADLNQDGHLDLAIQGPDGADVIVGSASGTFTELVVGGDYRFVDFNRDGLLDLLNVSSGILQILVRTPDGGHIEAYRQTLTDASIDTVKDLEGDGDPDVVLFEKGMVWILLNEGDAMSMQSVPADSYRLADLDTDGRDELLVQKSRDVTVYRVDAGGQFVQAFQTTTSMDCEFDAVADLDTDGNLDVTMRRKNNDTIEILLGAGDTTLNELVTVYRDKYQFADWNSDGNTDLLYLDGTKLTLLLGDGAGNFHESFAKSVSGSSRISFCATVDQDGDGDRDVVLDQWRDDFHVFLNNGDGTFVQRGPLRGYQLADWNGDARMDLLSWTATRLVLETAGENGQYEEVFQMPLGNEDGSVQLVRDLDADGDLDLVLRSDAVYLMMNAGDATFSRVDLPAVASDVFDVFDVRDLNGDGWPDLLGWGPGVTWGDLIVFLGDDVEPYQQTIRLPVGGDLQFLEEPVDLDRDGYVDQVVAWEPWQPGAHVVVFWGSPQDRPRTPIDLVFPRRIDPSSGLWGSSFSISARDIDHDGDYDLVSDTRVIYNQVDRLHPWGDVDRNGWIDVDDVDTLSEAIRLQDPRRTLFDLNQDGVLDRGDLSFLVRDVLGTHPGDADLNGVFNSSDMVRVFQIGEYEDSIPGNSTWADGDWDGDGDFTSSDMVFACQAGGYTMAARGVFSRPPTLTAIAADIAQALQELPSSQIKQQRRPGRR